MHSIREHPSDGLGDVRGIAKNLHHQDVPQMSATAPQKALPSLPAIWNPLPPGIFRPLTVSVRQGNCYSRFFPCFFCRAHLALASSDRRFRAAALSVRPAAGAAFAATAAPLVCAAQRRLEASDIALRAAALSTLRPAPGAFVAALTLAHLALVAATIRAMPSGLMRRFPWAAGAADATVEAGVSVLGPGLPKGVGRSFPPPSSSRAAMALSRRSRCARRSVRI
jgi:hypothetical protein